MTSIKQRHDAYKAKCLQDQLLTRTVLEDKLYDKAYSWELVPGSDQMATTIGVLPKIGSDSGYDFYAGLVTVEAGTVPQDQSVDAAWYLYSADTPATVTALNTLALYNPSAAHPAGVYIALYYAEVSLSPPYAFPEGWTPGNTTGSGPVLPSVGERDGYELIAGLVTVAPGSPPADTDVWCLWDITTALNYDALNDGDFLSLAEKAVTGGAFLGGAYVTADHPMPTALPAGWTFRPYGLGPIAITDENAGGLIGDVAYVVSGYVYFPVLTDDQILAAAQREPTYRGALAVGSYAPGDVVTNTGYQGPMIVTSSFTIASDNNGNLLVESGTQGYDAYNGTPLYQRDVMAAGDHCWPFIERFDLAAKKWLPRIPMPDLGEGVRYAAEGGIAGVIDGKLYFGGGDSNVITGAEFFVYDPTDDSITRLADIPNNNPDTDLPDFSPYGVVGGRLYYSGYFHNCFYDPVTNEWTLSGGDLLAGQVSDQAAGFEIDSNLWFVYEGRTYIFDPVALTVTAKAVASTITAGSPFLIDGKFQVFQTLRDEMGTRLPQFRAATYDPLADTWVVRTDVADRNSALDGIPGDYSGEFVGVTWQDAPYMLSGVTSTTAGDALGVYGLTGVSLDRPRVARLQDLVDHAPDVNWVAVPTPYGISLVPTPLRYCRRRGVVYIEGQIILPNDANYGLMFVLPPGFRPHTDFGARLYAQTTVGLTELVDARLYVQATGEVSLYNVAGVGNRLVDLHASFPADF